MRRPVPIIFAAGGLLWSGAPGASAVAVVHRSRHGDWVLPKGKLEAGERWQDAALREVREETGYQADLGEFAGVVSYAVSGVPKVVLFWNMRRRGESAFVPGEEVDQVAWLPTAEALQRLNHEGEKHLLAAVTGR